MTPINGQRLFYLTPETIWAGEDLESCIIAVCDATGLTQDECVSEPRELTDDEVAREFDGGRTLASELQKALDQWASTPVFFAEVEQIDEPDDDAEQDLVEVVPMKGKLLPPSPDGCPVCATKHEPNLPHNQQSLYYQMRFKGLHGRWPTWADAGAHCEPSMVAMWKQELTKRGIEWTSPAEGEPIAEPPANFKHEVVEV